MRTNRLLVAAALIVAGCASPGTPTGNEASIVAGVSTRNDVATVAGKPVAEQGTQSVYEYRDLWGYKTELGVTYDANGTVQSAFSQRLDEN